MTTMMKPVSYALQSSGKKAHAGIKTALWVLVLGGAIILGPSVCLGSGSLSLLEPLDSEVSVSSDDGAKSPTIAFLSSLVIPGTGELYLGKKRGYILIGLEAAFWTGFALLYTEGLDKREEYEDYADAHWQRSDYLVWYSENCVDCDDACDDKCRALPDPETDKQHYYEDIGKYPHYESWWDDTEGSSKATRSKYKSMRVDSNNYLKGALYFSMAAVLNHVGSALESLIIGRREASEGRVSLRFDSSPDSPGVFLNLKTSF